MSISQIPCTRKLPIHKKMIPAGIVPACPACTGSPKGNSTYVSAYLSTGGKALDRSRVLVFCIDICMFRFACTYCSGVVLFSRRQALCVVGGASRVFSRTGLGCWTPDARVASSKDCCHRLGCGIIYQVIT